MKRKSYEIVASIYRRQRKNKTEGYRVKLKPEKCVPDFFVSERVSAAIVEELVGHMDRKISEKGEQQSVQHLTRSCLALFKQVATLACPQHHEEEIKETTEDLQPQRIEFDPICGFDKLRTLRNRKSQQGFSNTTSDLKGSRMNVFGGLQNNKKQSQKSQKWKEQLVPLEPNPSDSSNYDLKEAKYREMLFNMFSNTDSDKVYKGTLNPRLSRVGQGLKLNPFEEYQYDYNGQKMSINSQNKSAFNNKNSTSNLLKTTYRVLEDTQIADKKSHRRQSKKPALLDVRRLSKEIVILRNSKIQTARDQSFFQKGLIGSQDILMKNLVESKFKDSKIKLKQIEKVQKVESHRRQASKVL